MDGKDNKIESNNLINCRGNLLDLSIPRIMAILNVNDDSFYQGSRVSSEHLILQRVEQFLSEGADVIDVGAISTRPGADLKDVEIEKERIVPAVQSIVKAFPDALISVDTFRSEIAKITIGEGAHIINDVYGGRFDGEMFKTVGELNVPYVLMHSRGFSKDMTRKAEYSDITREVIQELARPLKELRSNGVKDVVIDPGFGFAKSINGNYELLENLDALKSLECPILAGLSRKSMIYKKLKIESDEALNGTTVLNTIAFTKGASLFRVHDVKPVRQMIDLLT